jgi:hypothetical protein
MLLVAIAAINRPGSIGLEGNLTRLSALCAGGIAHLSGAAVEAASASASVSLHLFSLTFWHRFREPILLQNIPSNQYD